VVRDIGSRIGVAARSCPLTLPLAKSLRKRGGVFLLQQSAATINGNEANTERAGPRNVVGVARHSRRTGTALVTHPH